MKTLKLLLALAILPIVAFAAGPTDQNERANQTGSLNAMFLLD